MKVRVSIQSCKRKSQLADGLATYIKDLNLNENDEIEVITLSLKEYWTS